MSLRILCAGCINFTIQLIHYTDISIALSSETLITLVSKSIWKNSKDIDKITTGHLILSLNKLQRLISVLIYIMLIDFHANIRFYLTGYYIPCTMVQRKQQTYSIIVNTFYFLYLYLIMKRTCP